ncbi:unnamed protein product [Callosobruchus maculatus]|uniref:Uncharacterized protein n=1 Tax=Callosobruchus maculatus TaxID=64391 RepID=A0A653BZ89_CALMS|nr:unnamed protein product [Callosobruchus maculatus]
MQLNKNISPSVYECCKGKEVSNYVCIVCSNIYHKSCCARKKDVMFVDKHKIYCSKKCALKADEEEEQIVVLRKLLNGAQQEIEDRDKFIDSLKKKNLAFEDDVIDMETSYTSEIENNKSMINKLEHKLDQKCKQICALEARLSNMSTENELLLYEVYALKKQLDQQKTRDNGHDSSRNEQNNKECVVMVNLDKEQTTKAPHCNTNNVEEGHCILNSENSLDNANVSDTRTGEDASTDDDQPGPAAVDLDLAETTLENAKVKKNYKRGCVTSGKNVVIVSDEVGVNAAASLNPFLEKYNFSASGIVRPYADCCDISKSIFSNAIHCTQDDVLIVMLNTGNISNFRSLKLALKQIIPYGKLTNLLLVVKYEFEGDENIGNYIQQQIRNYCNTNKNTSIEFRPLETSHPRGLIKIIKQYFLDNSRTNSRTVLKTVKLSTLLRSNAATASINTSINTVSTEETQQMDKFFRD